MMYSAKQLVFCIKEWKRMKKISRAPEFAQQRQRAVIIRLVHSIEKGLCLEAPRMGFGIPKLNKLYQECESFISRYGGSDFCLQMAADAVEEYLRFHESRGYSNDDIAAVKKNFDSLGGRITRLDVKAGGTQAVSIKETGGASFSDMLRLRHSIREFEKKPLSDDDIRDAVAAAQMCPSACNRQAYRAYVLPSEKLLKLYDNNLSGIGGFAESADRFILITGKISAYDFSEYNQYIVSASIFASYLSLALLDKNIGSCIVQRPLRHSKQNQRIMKACGIPDDEQIVMMMAIGALKESFSAPISGRFPVDEIVKFCK